MARAGWLCPARLFDTGPLHAQGAKADATRTVDEWTSSYRNLQADLAAIKARADEAARLVADEAACHVSAAALWPFVGSLPGLLVNAVRHHAGVH